MRLEEEVRHHANKDGNPYATLLDAGFLLYEVRLIMHGFAWLLEAADLVEFVRKSIRDERTNTMTTINSNNTFENCLGKDFKKVDSDTIYRFCNLDYGVGQSTEIVGEFESDGADDDLFMTAVINDPDAILKQIASGDMIEVSTVAEIH